MSVLNSPSLLLLGVALSIACGMYFFFALCRARRWTQVLLWWALAALTCAGIAWAGFSMNLQGRGALLTGLILPMWAFGGLLGMLAGLVWYRKS